MDATTITILIGFLALAGGQIRTASRRREKQVAVQFRLLPVLLVRLDDCARHTGFRRTEAIRAAITNWCERVKEIDARRRQTMTRRQSGPEDDLA